MQKTQTKAPTAAYLGFAIVIISTVIGAGFASGREIVTFFCFYGKYSLIFALLFGALMIWGIKNFFGFNHARFSPFEKNFWAVSIFITEIISVSAMIAGLKSTLAIIFGSTLPFFILLFLCFVCLCFNISALEKIGGLLLPILIFFIVLLFVSRLSIAPKEPINFTVAAGSPLAMFSFPLIYAGLNLLSLFPLCQSYKLSLAPKAQKSSAVFSSIILSALVIMLIFITLTSGTAVADAEIPVLVYTGAHLNPLLVLAAIAIIIGIITTLLSGGFILKNQLSPFIKNNFLLSALIILAGYALSLVGFASIVASLYPVTGILGFSLAVRTGLPTKAKANQFSIAQPPTNTKK